MAIPIKRTVLFSFMSLLVGAGIYVRAHASRPTPTLNAPPVPALLRFDAIAFLPAFLRSGLCSGFHTREAHGSADLICTARHCVEPLPKEASIHVSLSAQGRRFAGVHYSFASTQVLNLLAKDFDHISGVDLSCAPVDRAIRPPLAVSNHPLSPGDDLFVVGYPGGVGPTITACKYLGRRVSRLSEYQSRSTEKKFGLFSLAKCSRPLGKGASGGLVYSAEGVVGAHRGGALTPSSNHYILFSSYYDYQSLRHRREGDNLPHLFRDFLIEEGGPPASAKVTFDPQGQLLQIHVQSGPYAHTVFEFDPLSSQGYLSKSAN